MQSKRGPFFLITGLVIILVFIVGVRYGQKVAETNKKINYELSISPAKFAPTAKIEYKTYSHAGCGISFLYPSSLSLSKETTTSAILSEGKNVGIEFNCEKNNNLAIILNDPKEATAEVMLNNKTVTARLTNNTSTLVFKSLNNLNGKTIFLAVAQTLYPLFERSVEYMK